MRFSVLTLLWFTRVQLRVADTCPWLVTVCLLGSLNMQSYNITLTYARKHPRWTWQLSAPGRHLNKSGQINSRLHKSIPLCLITIDSTKDAHLVAVYIYSYSRTHHFGSVAHYIITLSECRGENIPFLNQLNGNWLQPAECMFPTVCFLHWGQDKCYPPPHGQNKGWALWTENADSALSYQLDWKTATCNRKQSYTVSSFLHTGGEKKSWSLYLVLQCFLYDPRAIKI